MIIIPELETVVITPPRTASTALHDAVKKRYPQAIGLYRHMEANGIPVGYDMWRKVGVARQPLERLWSVFKYAYMDTNKSSFEDWILNNKVPLVTSYDFNESFISTINPYYGCLHTIPENKKSQFIYLRPDLGTQVFHFDKLGELEDELDIFIPHMNETKGIEIPEISLEAEMHIRRFFSWEITEFGVASVT